MAAEVNLTIDQFADFVYPFVCKDSDEVIIDLTGAEIRMQIRQHVVDEDSIYDASTTLGNIVIDDEEDGTATLTIPVADTSELNFENARYDIFVDTPTRVYRVQRGHVDVSLAVTREDI